MNDLFISTCSSPGLRSYVTPSIMTSDPLPCFKDDAKRQSVSLEETPRGSWASSIFDLKNSSPDALLPYVLERTAAEDMDRHNTEARQQGRHCDLLGLYPAPDEVGGKLALPVVLQVFSFFFFQNDILDFTFK